MKTVLKKTVTIETKRHNFDNDFAYIEVWSNTILKDCFFAEKDFLYPDGTLKFGGIKYFPCNPSCEKEKVIKPYNYLNFKRFEWLYYIDKDGVIKNISNRSI